MIINSKHVGGGITPTGNINITDTNATDVTNYATAQVVDADLVASNIKKDVNILGVIGSFDGSGGAAQIATGSITPAQNIRELIVANLTFTPKSIIIIANKEYRDKGIKMTTGYMCINDFARIIRSDTPGTISLNGWYYAPVRGAIDANIDTCSVVSSFSASYESQLERKTDAFRVTSYNETFQFASGVQYDWAAIG